MTDEKPPKSKLALAFETIDKLVHEGGLRFTSEPQAEEPKPKLTVFACGPAPGHECDDKGPEVELLMECRKCEGTGTVSPNGGALNCKRCKGTGQRVAGSSVSCSVCGMSAMDRSLWD